MKKNILSIAALAVLFASCSKDDNSNASDKDSSAKVNVSLGSYGRSVGTPTVDGDIVAVDATQLRFIPIRYGNAVENQALILPLVPGTSADEYTTTASVATNMSGAFLELNYDNGTLTSNVNTRQGDVLAPVVLCDNRAETGVETDFVINGSTYELTTDLIPEMARMQIVNNLVAGHDFKGSTAEGDLTIKDITLDAIYINNTKLDRADSGLNRTGDSQSVWDAAYNTEANGGVKYNLYDLEPSEDAWKNIIGDDGLLAAGKEVNFFGAGRAVGDETEARIGALGYNIFEQALDLDGTNKVLAKKFQPHISFKLTFTGTGIGKYEKETEYTRYLNIVAFKDGQKYTTIERGNVYEMEISDILELAVDPESELTEEPDPIDASVEITVKVTEWTVIPVTPELN